MADMTDQAVLPSDHTLAQATLRYLHSTASTAYDLVGLEEEEWCHSDCMGTPVSVAIVADWSFADYWDSGWSYRRSRTDTSHSTSCAVGWDSSIGRPES
jgi:hypothetical protein